jgi:hypothetical protein
MVRVVRALAAVALFATTQVSFGAAQGNSLESAIDRGEAMYLYDRAAWVSSDDAVARLPAERQVEVGGWVVTPAANGLHVDYFGKGQAADRVVYAVDLNGETLSNATVYPVAAEPTLKEPALQMAHALRAAWSEMDRHSDWHPCTNARFNTIVLPPGKDRTTPVYFLTPQTETGSFPLGGHYEVDIAADGKVAFTRAFTHGCITLTKAPQDDGARSVALMVTHLLDPHPTEIHVFEQYYVGLPVFVMTGPKSVWKVEGGRIEDVSATMAK